MYKIIERKIVIACNSGYDIFGIVSIEILNMIQMNIYMIS